MLKILDSYALLAFFEKEPGFEKVESLFVEAMDTDSFLLMTSVNFGEVYYIVYRECGLKKAQEIKRIILETLPIEIINVDIPLTEIAASFKAEKKMSYADCFAVALTKQNKGQLITGDKEFKEVENIIKIDWV